MKKLIIIGICQALLLLHAFAAEDTRSITVSGSAEIELAPDTLKWMFDIHAKAGELERAQDANDRVLRELLSVLQSRDIPKEQLRASAIQFGRNYEMRGRERAPEGFFARRSLTLTTHDVENYGRLLERVSTLEGLELRNIQRESSKVHDAQRKARVQALEDAKQKAMEMAAALEMKVLNPLEILEGHSDRPIPFQERGIAMAMADSDETSVDFDQITVRQTVTVRFEIIPR